MGAHAGHNTGSLAHGVATLERRAAGLVDWSPRGMLLYVLPLPLLFALCVSLLRGDLGQIVGQLAALAACWTAAVLARRGLRAEAVYRHRRIARMPAPRKTSAALLLGAGVFAGAWLAVGHDLVLAVLLGAGSSAGFVLAYGLDPWGAKRPPAELGPDREEVIRTLEEAEARIQRIEAASRRLRAGELSQRLERIAGSARAVVDLLEEDPRDLRRARRFLNVYLSGAQQVTERYVHARPRRATPELDDRFRSVLGTIETVFEEQRQHLLEDEFLDLDVQIEVLSRQLQREAVA
jgi:5-bromo-4-chloroindolyl phosphate hydrolysis protein